MKRVLRHLFLVVFVLSAAASAVAWDAWRQLNTPLLLDDVQRVTVERGQRLREVVDSLGAQGFFIHPRQGFYLWVYGRLHGERSRIKAGDFDLAPGTTPLTALAVFVEGRAVFSELRIVEGWTFAQALDLIRVHPDLAHTLPDELSASEAVQLLKLEGIGSPEGRIFPDTYRFARGMRDVDFLRHAAQLLNQHLKAEWDARAAELPLASDHEALILASIVEKETGNEVERSRIAGVFVRRLKLGMLLQTDPTVIYGLGESFDGNLRRADLERDTPYNSYLRTGLPPTPICLPSRASLRAALHPDDDGSLFFVSRGDGTSAFSKTLEEHNAAVRRFQLKQAP